MASWSTKRVRISFLVAFVLIFAVVANASVTWRRVTRPTSKPRESTTELSTTSTVKPSSRSPITWKRSTIARRSIDAAENRARADEYDDLDEANSSQEHITEENTDSEVKPLLPGSRPGFWFDSTRRKKTASLLKPGARRNSLFPTRSSTTTTSPPTTASVAPLTIAPRTPPSVANINAKNSNSRNSSRSRSTNSPIAFKRRLRTTKAARKSPTTNPNDAENKKNEAFIEADKETENEMTENDNEKEDRVKDTETEDIKPIRPKLNIRRRPFNSTRLSWTRQNNRKSSRTTTSPQQLTTTLSSASISAKDNDRFSKRTTAFPRTRTRSKAKTFAPEVTWSRKRLTTDKPTTSTTDIMSSEEVSTDDDASESSKKTPASNVHDEDLNSLVETSTPPINDFGARQDSLELSKPKLKTTVEPFYITREYGRIATAIPDIRNNKESTTSTTQDLKADKELIPTPTTKLTTKEEHVNPKLNETRKRRKRIKTKTTEAPPQTTTIEDNNQDFDDEYDYEIAGIDTSVENVNSFELRNTTNDSLAASIDSSERFSEKLEVDSRTTTTSRDRQRSVTTTIRPVTQPPFSTIDPNSNSYVVWSLGNGGSGWSYQNHGGQVKWSAQNSEAEGDNWSVVGKDEDENIQAGFNHQWKPIRNSTKTGLQKSEKISKIKEEKHMPPRMETAKPHSFSPSVMYMPPLSFKNETIFNLNIPDVTSLPYQITNTSLSPSSDYFGEKPIPNDNSSSLANVLSQTFNQDPQPANFVSQTPLPGSPTLESEFNEQIEGIINQYPIVPNYPYVAEIRDTYKNLPNTVEANPPTTNIFEVQKYVTVTMDENMQKETTTPAPVQQIAQFVQEPQSYSYPSAYPQTEIVPIFNENSGKGILMPDPASSVPGALRPDYISAIPPELAKAVVEAKKWQVVGSGGDDGWSLLNEDGLLEWKIHNVGGQWRVSSAEQLKETQAPPQQTESKLRANDRVVDDNTNAESYGYNSQENNQGLPKVWTLEDDYEKWRAVSAERGTPSDVSSEETSKSSQEYGYDSREYYSDYYSDEDYYNSGIVNEDVSSLKSNEDYGGRPLWGDGENQMIYSYPKEDYPQFSRNIEVANSREDAVAAWKSLVAQQGHWKLSENVNEGFQTHPQHQISQNTIRNADRRISTAPPRPEISIREQKKSQEVRDRRYESLRGNTRGQYVNRGSDQLEQVEHSVRDHGSNRNHKLQQTTRVNEEHLVGNSAQKRGHQRNIQHKEMNFSNIRHRNRQKEQQNNTHDPNYESKIESLVQKYKYQERNQPEESLHHVTRHENESKQQINKLIAAFTENNGYVSENIGKKYNNRNQAETAYLPDGRHINESREKNNNLQKDVYDSGTKISNQQYMNPEKEPFPASIQNHGKNEERNSEGLPEPRIRMRGNDYSKIESLINKLETVQREANGRAVIDLTELLKHMKSRRNRTATPLQMSELDANHPPRKADNNFALSMKHVEKDRTHNFPVREEEKERRENPQNLQRDRHYKLDMDSLGDIRDRITTLIDNNDNNENLRTNVRSQNYRNHQSERTNNQNQRKIFAERSNNQSTENQPIKQNIPINPNARMYPPARPTQQYKHERYSTIENPEKDTNEGERYTASQNTHRANPSKVVATHKFERPDSSSSEEIVVDLKDSKRSKPAGTRRQRRPSRRRSRRPNHPQPMVLKGETEVEDEEDGSRKNRKIIVIDYAGTQKRKSSVDKKDLELIIRNVKHRRSEVFEHSESEH